MAWDDLPEELRAELEGRSQLSRPANASRADAGRSTTTKRRSGLSGVELMEQALADAPKIGRNEAGFELAKALRDQGLSQTQAEQVMTMYADMVGPTNTKGQEEEYSVDEALASLRSAYTRAARDPDAKQSVASLLVELAGEDDVFHDDARRSYASVQADAHHETYAVDSAAYRELLTRRYYQDTGSAPSKQALTDALNALSARARFDGPELPVNLRVAGDDEVVYGDLGDADWRAVRVTAAGWEVISDPPVRFVRPDSLLALPEPVRGGDLSELRRFINVIDADWPLLIAYLVGALRPTGPYPLLVLTGPEGAAKSSTIKVLRLLVDPNVAIDRGPPRDDRDLMIGAQSNHLLVLDNLSSSAPA